MFESHSRFQYVSRKKQKCIAQVWSLCEDIWEDLRPLMLTDYQHRRSEGRCHRAAGKMIRSSSVIELKQYGELPLLNKIVQEGNLMVGRRNQYGERRKNEDVFVEDSNYARHHIKKRVIEENMIPYVCDECGIGPVWNNKPMPLILDHINGKNNDNRLENLRFVCSNCDSQLPTYKSKNKKSKRIGEVAEPGLLRSS